MQITIELSEQEVRQILLSRVSKEASKHGHPSSTQVQIGFRDHSISPEILSGMEPSLQPLEELQISIVAQIGVAER